ncbi:unnamed protein product [Somion occarium]|uniref:Uncharacterized protein n=1 Tax=Somion occarium TaxID=3059160 RepID=A0ABP1CW37_9APHY
MSSSQRSSQWSGHHQPSPTPSGGSETLVGTPGGRSYKSTATSPTLRGDTIGSFTPPAGSHKPLSKSYINALLAENAYQLAFDVRYGSQSVRVAAGQYGLDAEIYHHQRVAQISILVWDIFVVDVFSRNGGLTVREVIDGISNGLLYPLSQEEIGKVTRRGTHVRIVPGQTRRIDVLPCFKFGGLVTTSPYSAIMQLWP